MQLDEGIKRYKLCTAEKGSYQHVVEVKRVCWNKALQLNCNYKQQLTKVEKNSFSEKRINVTGHFLNMREVAFSPQTGANKMPWSYK